MACKESADYEECSELPFAVTKLLLCLRVRSYFVDLMSPPLHSFRLLTPGRHIFFPPSTVTSVHSETPQWPMFQMIDLEGAKIPNAPEIELDKDTILKMYRVMARLQSLDDVFYNAQVHLPSPSFPQIILTIFCF